MVTWSTERYRDASQRRLAGESDANTEAALLEDLKAFWLVLFSEQLTWYPRERWNSLLGAVQVWHGTISVVPSMDLDLHRQLLGCRLYLNWFHDRFEETETDEETDSVAQEQQRLFVAAMTEAFDAIRTEPCVQNVLGLQPIPLKVLCEPDAPPLLERLLS